MATNHPPPPAGPRVHRFDQRPLSITEARVLGTLMEKARSAPDASPLTLTSLQSGGNERSSREPVLSLTEGEIGEAIDGLRQLHMVVETSGGRVTRYEHNVQRAVGVPEQSAVLLGMLVLRGPQTAGELRLNTERWYKFLDIASVDAFLEELQDRSPDKGGPLVVKLPRAPGAREQRWAHLLCGPVDAAALAASAAPGTSGATEEEMITLARRVSALEDSLAQLQAQLQNLHEQLGLSH